MDEFQNLPWRISEPAVLDIGTSFITEENIVKTYVYSLNTFQPYNFSSDEEIDEEQKQKPESAFLSKMPTYPKKSSLPKYQHKLCLNALELVHFDRCFKSHSETEQQIINEYNNLKPWINEENQLFLKFVEEQWNKCLHTRVNKVPQRLIIFAKEKFKYITENIIYNYDKFYDIKTMLPLSYVDNPVDCIHERCLLELGTVAKINNDFLKEKQRMSILIPSITGIIPEKEVLFTTKLPVSRDVHAEQLAKENNCDIVISLSGLKTIVDNFDPEYNATWDIPIIVKQYDKNNSKKKIIFIDKSLPKRNVDFRYINDRGRKMLLKTALCRDVAHTFNTPEFALRNTRNSGNAFDEIVEKITTENDSNGESMIEERSSEGDDNGEENLETAVQLDKTKQKRIKQKLQIHHNVSYQVWILKRNCEKNTLLKGSHDNKDIRLLVRSKVDGCHSDEKEQLKPVTLVPKVEYTCEYGADMLTKSELIRQWASLYFKPFSNLIRVRINNVNNVYNRIEYVNLNRLNTECLKHYSFAPTISLSLLYNLFSNMIEIESGNYILQHSAKNGPFAALLKSVPECGTNSINLHDCYDEKNYKIEKNSKWLPIDTTYILPYHIKYGFMPGMFPPNDISPKKKNTNNKFAMGKINKLKKKKTRKRSKRKTNKN